MIYQLTSAATVAIDPSTFEHRVDGVQAMAVTPGSDITFTWNPDNLPGQEYNLLITTTGVTSRTLTFSTNFKTTGTLATGTTAGKQFLMKFMSDGQNLVEVSRTAAM